MKTKFYEISSICKEDMKEYFSEADISKLDDADMQYIARKMGDVFCDCCYWEAMKQITASVLEDKRWKHENKKVR